MKGSYFDRYEHFNIKKSKVNKIPIRAKVMAYDIQIINYLINRRQNVSSLEETEKEIVSPKLITKHDN